MVIHLMMMMMMMMMRRRRMPLKERRIVCEGCREVVACRLQSISTSRLILILDRVRLADIELRPAAFLSSVVWNCHHHDHHQP